ncbi:MAG: hypothetical protein AMXMBFR12_01830 [Candidatus Babeliales bacterium]
MKKIIALSFLICFLTKGMENKVIVPIEQMPLLCDESDTVLMVSPGVSVLVLGGPVIYGVLTQPLGFDDPQCERKYISLLTEECIKTNLPCALDKPGWNKCISSLIDQYCGIEKDEYNHQLPGKRIAAWTPLMVAAVVTTGFQAGWLLGKWIARALHPKKPVALDNSMAIDE